MRLIFNLSVRWVLGMLFERIRGEKIHYSIKLKAKSSLTFQNSNFVYILADNSIKVIPTLKMKSLRVSGIELLLLLLLSRFNHVILCHAI